MTLLTRELIAHLRETFVLDWQGIHGVPHWARVKANGLRLAEVTGANVHVVELFAFLHDARRLDEDADPGHGRRAAALARELRGQHFDLADAEFALLMQACDSHSDGLITGADITVLTCWDADRLDLGRVGKRPAPLARLAMLSGNQPSPRPADQHKKPGAEQPRSARRRHGADVTVAHSPSVVAEALVVCGLLARKAKVNNVRESGIVRRARPVAVALEVREGTGTRGAVGTQRISNCATQLRFVHMPQLAARHSPPS